MILIISKFWNIITCSFCISIGQIKILSFGSIWVYKEYNNN